MSESVMINKTKEVFGKHKTGYIFPVTILIKPIFHTLKDGMEFLAIFRKEKSLKNIAYLISTYEL